MADSIRSRVPVIAGVAYIERIRRLPASFRATLAPEPDNRYFRHAIAVLHDGEKVGYVAPEVAAGIFESLNASAAPVACPARRSSLIDHETSGVELFLDLSELQLTSVE